MNRTYTKHEIKWAVDIVIGDDGFRSKEVIEVLKTADESLENNYLEDKIEQYMDKRIDTDG